MLTTPLGPIDDHEILEISAPSGTLPWIEVPAAVIQRSAEPGRFRPGYWLFRISEIALWGQNTTGWYADRLLLVVLSVSAAYVLAKRYVGTVLSALAGVLVVAGPQAESWYRLGPQEALATPLLLWGFAGIAWRRPWLGIALVMASALVKESYIPFVFAGVLFTAWSGYRRQAVIGGVLATMILAATLLANGRTEIYDQVRSISDSIGTARWMFDWTLVGTIWPVIALVAVLRGWRPSGRYILIGVVLLVAEAYLYAGLVGGRYLLPVGLLAIAASVAGLAYLAEKWPWSFQPMAAALAIVIGMNLVGAWFGARQWDGQARAWQAGISEARVLMAAHPDAVLEVEPRWASDYERVYSFRTFVPEGIAMLAPVPWPATDSLHDQRLAERMRMTSAGTGYPRGYAPWINQIRACIAITFAELAPTSCQWAVTVGDGS